MIKFCHCTYFYSQLAFSTTGGEREWRLTNIKDQIWLIEDEFCNLYFVIFWFNIYTFFFSEFNQLFWRVFISWTESVFTNLKVNSSLNWKQCGFSKNKLKKDFKGVTMFGHFARSRPPKILNNVVYEYQTRCLKIPSQLFVLLLLLLSSSSVTI
jgi:hypothetical protein